MKLPCLVAMRTSVQYEKEEEGRIRQPYIYISEAEYISSNKGVWYDDNEIGKFSILCLRFSVFNMAISSTSSIYKGLLG